MKIKLFEEFDYNAYNHDIKDWFVVYGLGGGMNTKHYEIVEQATQKEVEQIAWDLVVEHYQSYAGLHGLKNWSEVEEELREEYPNEEFDDDSIQEAYNEEIERWAIYYAEELDSNNKEQIDNIKEEGLRLSPRIKKILNITNE